MTHSQKKSRGLVAGAAAAVAQPESSIKPSFAMRFVLLFVRDPRTISGSFPLETPPGPFIIAEELDSLTALLTISFERRGCSSVVERHVANVAVVGSSPITRSCWPRRPVKPLRGFPNLLGFVVCGA